MDKKYKASNVDINKIAAAVFALNLFEILLLIGIVSYSIINRNMKALSGSEGYIIIIVVLVLIVTNSIISLRYSKAYSNFTLKFHMLENTMEELQAHNISMRTQRHDFMNHLQVVYGLMEMKENSEALEYIERVYSDIQRVNKFLKTANPAVNALLQAKVIFAEKRGIEVNMDIRTKMDRLSIEAWEFCRIIGNLVDNAIFALKDKPSNRIITIELYEEMKNYGFRIANNGPKIPEEIQQKIFDIGFTTKGELGDGMGLTIVKNIIEEAGGSISLKSDNENTTFEGLIPR